MTNTSRSSRNGDYAFPSQVGFAGALRPRSRRLAVLHHPCDYPDGLRYERLNLELLAEIKECFPGLPVMMVTAFGDDERRCRAAEHGATEFITKSVDFDH